MKSTQEKKIGAQIDLFQILIFMSTNYKLILKKGAKLSVSVTFLRLG